MHESDRRIFRLGNLGGETDFQDIERATGAKHRNRIDGVRLTAGEQRNVTIC